MEQGTRYPVVVKGLCPSVAKHLDVPGTPCSSFLTLFFLLLWELDWELFRGFLVKSLSVVSQIRFSQK